MNGFTRRLGALASMPLLFGALSVATARPAAAAADPQPGFKYDPNTQTMTIRAWPGDENSYDVFYTTSDPDNDNIPARIGVYDNSSSHAFGRPNVGECATSDVYDSVYPVENDAASGEALVHCDASKVRKIVIYGGDLADSFTVHNNIGDGSDVPSRITVEMHGGSGPDSFSGGDGTDLVYGDSGADTYYAADSTDGNDVVDLGTDTDTDPDSAGVAPGDTVDYSGLDTGVSVNLATGTETSTAQDHDTLVNVENVNGTQQADNIVGNDQANEIHGGNGNDTIDGAGGNDKLYGEDDNDTIHGGADDDTIVGGAGSDSLYGDGGADTVDAQDNAVDAIVNCGNNPGDSVTYDASVEYPSGCNLPPPSATVDVVTVGRTRVMRFTVPRITGANASVWSTARNGAVPVIAYVSATAGVSLVAGPGCISVAGHANTVQCRDIGAITVNGGDATDVIDLAGSIGATVNGNGGNDQIHEYGKVANSIFGGAGNDTIWSNKGAIDRVDCGTGADTVHADLTSNVTDLIANCEARLPG